MPPGIGYGIDTLGLLNLPAPGVQSNMPFGGRPGSFGLGLLDLPREDPKLGLGDPSVIEDAQDEFASERTRRRNKRARIMAGIAQALPGVVGALTAKTGEQLQGVLDRASEELAREGRFRAELAQRNEEMQEQARQREADRKLQRELQLRDLAFRGTESTKDRAHDYGVEAARQRGEEKLAGVRSEFELEAIKERGKWQKQVEGIRQRGADDRQRREIALEIPKLLYQIGVPGEKVDEFQQDLLDGHIPPGLISLAAAAGAAEKTRDIARSNFDVLYQAYSMELDAWNQAASQARTKDEKEALPPRPTLFGFGDALYGAGMTQRMFLQIAGQAEEDINKMVEFSQQAAAQDAFVSNLRDSESLLGRAARKGSPEELSAVLRAVGSPEFTDSLTGRPVVSRQRAIEIVDQVVPPGGGENSKRKRTLLLGTMGWTGEESLGLDWKRNGERARSGLGDGLPSSLHSDVGLDRPPEGGALFKQALAEAFSRGIGDPVRDALGSFGGAGNPRSTDFSVMGGGLPEGRTAEPVINYILQLLQGATPRVGNPRPVRPDSSLGRFFTNIRDDYNDPDRPGLLEYNPFLPKDGR